MNKSEKGRLYEDLVEKILTPLVEAGEYDSLERNVWTTTEDGKTDADILLVKKGSFFDVKTIVECKDWSSKLGIGFVREFLKKIEDLGAHKGVIVSKAGFSAPAISRAKRAGITLLRADEVFLSDVFPSPQIPVILRKQTIIGDGTEFRISIDPKANATLVPNDRRALFVNDKSVFQWLAEKWNTNDIDEDNGNHLILDFSEVKPRFIRNKLNQKIELESFKIRVSVRTEYFFGYLEMKEKGYLVEKVMKNEKEWVFPFNESPDDMPELKRVGRSDIPKIDSIHLSVLVRDAL